MEFLSYSLLLILPFLFLVILKHYYSSHHKTLNSPPSPPSLPIIGHFHLIRNSLHLSLASLSSKYGPTFSLRLGCKPFVVISSPSAIAECFNKNDIIFANRPTSMAGDILTYNYVQFLSSPYGHLWRTLRRFSVVELLSSNSLQKSAKLREDEMLKITRVLCMKEGQRVNLNDLISTFSFNIMMRALAGKSCVGEEDIGGEVGKETIKRMKAIFIPSMELGICDYFPVLRWVGYKGVEKNLVGLYKIRDEFLENLFDEVRKRSEGFDETNMIATLLARQAADPEFYTHDVIKSLVLVLILAGTDTSALTVEWAMSLLLSHPEELVKVKQEIDEKVGHEHILNDSDVAKLPYLSWVVNETLRLHPAAPLLFPHYSTEDCVVSGYNIPKGTILLANAWAMHRDPTLWDDPNEFNPERFRAVDMEKEGHKFIPFGIGRRACPGAAMAMRTIGLALGVFIQCFEWEKPLDDEDLDFDAKLKITLHKAKPLEAVCSPRNEATHILSQL